MRSDDEELRLVREAAQGLAADDARQLLDGLYRPVVRAIEALALQARRAGELPLVLSVSGLPGTGKSTLVAVLERWLGRLSACSVASFSLDDLYLTTAERAELGRRIHPLLAHRGVPGTHDVGRGLELVRRLRQAVAGEATPLPRFDKLTDAHFDEATWPVCVGRPDVLLCDGWFWGARPADPALLEAPLNAREREEDPDGTWRRAVNTALGVGFPELFAVSSFHVHLAAPSHAASVRWRVEQGRQARTLRGLDPDEVDPARIEHFLQLFERVGRLPVHFERGFCVRLGEGHLVESIEGLG